MSTAANALPFGGATEHQVQGLLEERDTEGDFRVKVRLRYRANRRGGNAPTREGGCRDHSLSRRLGSQNILNVNRNSSALLLRILS